MFPRWLQIIEIPAIYFPKQTYLWHCSMFEAGVQPCWQSNVRFVTLWLTVRVAKYSELICYNVIPARYSTVVEFLWKTYSTVIFWPFSTTDGRSTVSRHEGKDFCPFATSVVHFFWMTQGIFPKREKKFSLSSQKWLALYPHQGVPFPPNNHKKRNLHLIWNIEHVATIFKYFAFFWKFFQILVSCDVHTVFVSLFVGKNVCLNLHCFFIFTQHLLCCFEEFFWTFLKLPSTFSWTNEPLPEREIVFHQSFKKLMLWLFSSNMEAWLASTIANWL